MKTVKALNVKVQIQDESGNWIEVGVDPQSRGVQASNQTILNLLEKSDSHRNFLIKECARLESNYLLTSREKDKEMKKKKLLQRKFSKQKRKAKARHNALWFELQKLRKIVEDNQE